MHGRQADRIKFQENTQSFCRGGTSVVFTCSHRYIFTLPSTELEQPRAVELAQPPCWAVIKDFAGRLLVGLQRCGRLRTTLDHRESTPEAERGPADPRTDVAPHLLTPQRFDLLLLKSSWAKDPVGWNQDSGGNKKKARDDVESTTSQRVRCWEGCPKNGLASKPKVSSPCDAFLHHDWFR